MSKTTEKQGPLVKHYLCRPDEVLQKFPKSKIKSSLEIDVTPFYKTLGKLFHENIAADI